MAIANCSVCNGEINTESSPSGKCVRCTESNATAPSKPGATSTQKPGAFGNPDPRPEPRVATNPGKNEQESKTALEHAKKEATDDADDNPFSETHAKGEHAKKSHR